jgi:hypothetical protein
MLAITLLVIPRLSRLSGLQIEQRNLSSSLVRLRLRNSNVDYHPTRHYYLLHPQPAAQNSLEFPLLLHMLTVFMPTRTKARTAIISGTTLRVTLAATEVAKEGLVAKK